MASAKVCVMEMFTPYGVDPSPGGSLCRYTIVQLRAGIFDNYLIFYQ